MSRGVMIIVGLLVLVGCEGLVGAESAAGRKLTDEQVHRLFHQANDAFRKANEKVGEPEAERLYGEAILSYERIINEGQVRNAKLYYNLANAYFLKQDLGRAILNYRRAEKLDGSDAQIQKNLAFARSKRIDQIQLKSQQRVMQTLFFWHYDFSMRSRFVLACVFFAIVCIALTVIIWIGRSAPAMATTVIAGILFLCFALSVVVQAKNEAGLICGVVTANQVVARQGDGNNYAASFKEPLHSGTEFDVLEQRVGWLHIQLADETDCWIPQTTAKLI